MSRNLHWSEADLAKLTGARALISPKIKKEKKPQPDYISPLQEALRDLGIESQREYKFLHDRRFRFDLVILPISTKIAIEFEGAVFTGGRHTRPLGFINDAKKYNLATMHGWKLLRYTTADSKTNGWEITAAKEIQGLINGGTK